jgi:hypothetical protein
LALRSASLCTSSERLPLCSFAGGLEPKRNWKFIRIEAIFQTWEQLQ